MMTICILITKTNKEIEQTRIKINKIVDKSGRGEVLTVEEWAMLPMVDRQYILYKNQIGKDGVFPN